MNVTIIGGGIVGATTAFYLTQAGISITLVDEGTGQATKAAAGIISPWLSQRRNKNWYHLAQAGAHLYPSLIADLKKQTDFNAYNPTGAIMFKKKATTLEKTYQLGLERKKEAPEIGALNLLTPLEQLEKFPYLSVEQPGLWVGGSARVDGTKLLEALYTAITQQGGQIIRDKVSSISPLAQNNWSVQTKKQQWQASHLVLSTGAWLPELLTPLGYTVDVHPQKGQLLAFQIPELKKNLPVILPIGEGDIIPTEENLLLIGATHENEAGFDLTPDLVASKEMRRNVSDYLSLDLKTPDAVRVGTRAYTSDFLPFFGHVVTEDHLLVASGLGSSGLTTGPMIGKLLSQLLLKQPTDLPTEYYTPTPYIKKTTVS